MDHAKLKLLRNQVKPLTKTKWEQGEQYMFIQLRQGVKFYLPYDSFFLLGQVLF